MNEVRSILIFSCLMFSIILGSNAQPLSNQKKLKIEQQVDSIFHASIEAAERLDYDKLSKGVDDRYNAGFIVNRSYYPQYNLLIEQLKENRQEVVQQNITIENEKITVLSDRIVLLTASGNAKAEINSGQIFNAGFLWSFVYEKINNDWKVIQSHQSNTR